jgi:hypothetical protein
MKTKILLLVLGSIFLFSLGCSNDDDLSNEDNNETNTESTINPVLISDALKKEFDYVFSDNNEIAKNVKGNKLLFAINSEQELKEIGYVPGLSSQAVDFANQTVVWGKILTSSVSDKILDKQLSVNSSDKYNYEVIIEQYAEHWTALGYLYFWEIYPKKINATDISLIVNDTHLVNLIGDWVNQQQDTLSFLGERLVDCKLHSTYSLLYDYTIKGDSISMMLVYSSDLNSRRSYYFNYSEEQIEIHNLQGVEQDFYKRINNK